MSAVPAARHLADFSLNDGAAQWSGATRTQPVDASASEAAKLGEAFERGVEHGRAEAEADFQVKLEEQRNAYVIQVVADRDGWATGMGADLASRIDAGLAEFQARVAETTARILKPFVASELHRQAIAELQATLGALLATDGDVRLEITGPADVLDGMRRHFSGKAATNITYTASGDCDVRVVTGQTVIETQLKTWLAKLDEAVR